MQLWHPFWPSWVFLHLEQDIALARASSRLVGPVLLAAALLAAALALALAFLVLCTGTEYWLLSLVIHSLSLSEIWCSVAGGLAGSPLWILALDSINWRLQSPQDQPSFWAPGLDCIRGWSIGRMPTALATRPAVSWQATDWTGRLSW